MKNPSGNAWAIEALASANAIHMPELSTEGAVAYGIGRHTSVRSWYVAVRSSNTLTAGPMVIEEAGASRPPNVANAGNLAMPWTIVRSPTPVAIKPPRTGHQSFEVPPGHRRAVIF